MNGDHQHVPMEWRVGNSCLYSLYDCAVPPQVPQEARAALEEHRLGDVHVCAECHLLYYQPKDKHPANQIPTFRLQPPGQG